MIPPLPTRLSTSLPTIGLVRLWSCGPDKTLTVAGKKYQMNRITPVRSDYNRLQTNENVVLFWRNVNVELIPTKLIFLWVFEENTDVFFQNWHFSSLKWGFNEIFLALQSSSWQDSCVALSGQFLLVTRLDCHYHSGSDQSVVMIRPKKNFMARSWWIYDIQFFIIHEPILLWIEFWIKET